MYKRESAGGVVVNSEDHVILVKNHGETWGFPKGTIEDGEEPLVTARREIFEETGVAEDDLDHVIDLGNYVRPSDNIRNGVPDPGDKLIYMHLFRSSATVLSPRCSDISEARWIRPDQVIDTLTHQGDKDFFLSIAANLK